MSAAISQIIAPPQTIVSKIPTTINATEIIENRAGSEAKAEVSFWGVGRFVVAGIGTITVCLRRTSYLLPMTQQIPRR
jgi:hypothetical protein